MAPGAAKGRKALATKNAPKPVVPAIPLPYVKRQAAVAASSATPPVSPPEPKPAQPADAKRRTDAPHLQAENEAPTAVDAKPESQPQDDVIPANGADGPQSSSPGMDSSNVGATKTQASAAEVPKQATSEAGAAVNGVQAPMPHPAPLVVGRTNGAPPVVSSQRNNEPSTKHPKSRQHPPISPTRYQMPPPFQPGGRPMGPAGNGDMHRRPHPMHNMQNPPPRMHHAHASHGSVHFGAFHDSTSSSPAPPPSSGIAPPPGMPYPDERLPYMPPGANGYPPMMPYQQMMTVAGYDNYGRPNMAYTPVDSLGNYANNYGPPTPHSFHESHSSGPGDEGPINTQVPFAMNRNGLGPVEDANSQAQRNRMFGGPEHHESVANQRPLGQGMSPDDGADGLLAYIQQHFSSNELNDCTLELRYLDDRAAPVRIPGHRLVFARSPVLSSMLRRQALHSSPSDQSLQMICLETETKWIRSDAYYMAVQRLYGLPLLPLPPPGGPSQPGDFTEAGTASERLDFAISYAAAGHLIDWSSVVKRGCEAAAQLVNWHTMEKVIDFALEDFSDKGTFESYKYGDGSKILMGAVVSFIVNNLPLNFNLDRSLMETGPHPRLPSHPLEEPTLRPEGSNHIASPSMAARDSPVQMRQARRSQQLNHIQFGDLSLSEGQSGSAETPKATQQAVPTSHAILSRVLLNLPFTQLKLVLESSGYGNVAGWASAESRHRIIKDVVAEREARRQRALDAVIMNRVPEAASIQQCLRSPEPREHGKWSLVGWREEFLAHGNPDGPCLSRRWVPIKDIPNANVAAYP